MSKKLVVNFFGGAGVGKTEMAAKFYYELSSKTNLRIDMVRDFAKELIQSKCNIGIKHQWYVTANQSYRIYCSYNDYQVVLVDSPILLGPIFDPDASPALLALCLEHHHKFDNLNIILPRNLEKEYIEVGRVHSLTESISIDNRIVRLLEDNNIPYLKYDDYGETRILQLITREISQ